MDDKMREELDSAIATARRMLIDENGWTIHHPDLTTPAFYEELRAKSRDVLIEDELARRRKRVIQMAEEGRQRAEEEAQEIARKRKREADQHWENTRDDRVGDWRRFSGQTAGNDPPKKKIKKKIKVLG
jgi:DnaJ family protein C protein 8